MYKEHSFLLMLPSKKGQTKNLEAALDQVESKGD